MQTKNIINHKT